MFTRNMMVVCVVLGLAASASAVDTIEVLPDGVDPDAVSGPIRVLANWNGTAYDDIKVIMWLRDVGDTSDLEEWRGYQLTFDDAIPTPGCSGDVARVLGTTEVDTDRDDWLHQGVGPGYVSIADNPGYPSLAMSSLMYPGGPSLGDTAKYMCACTYTISSGSVGVWMLRPRCVVADQCLNTLHCRHSYVACAADEDCPRFAVLGDEDDVCSLAISPDDDTFFSAGPGGIRAPHDVFELEIEIPTGRCCVGGTCLGVLTEEDCAAVVGSAWMLGLDCSEPCTVCGDGIVEGDEDCEDGNTIDGDGCDSNCTFTGCGNGVVTEGEACDDGNLANTDACLTDCQPASCGDGFVWAGEEDCDDGNTLQTDACLIGCVAASCGDGIVWLGEEVCDDGNTDEDDGCLSSCQDPVCGDGIVTGDEACDDGNLDNSDACLNDCERATCGDGVLWLNHEECDDGDDDNTDYCVEGCLYAECGDGFVRVDVEECDDGNTSDNDDCLNSCQDPICGDGIVSGDEACDDGNDDNTDGCLTSCAWAMCGDGYLQRGVEDCDDGNTRDGDECPSDCGYNLGTEWVRVGVAGDAVTHPNESVYHEYWIGTFEVTAAEWTEFLNAVAASDTYDLYQSRWHSVWPMIQRDGYPTAYTYTVAPDWARRPVNYIGWCDAVRYCNWLHNGKPTGMQDLTTTEDGAYYIGGLTDPGALSEVVREPEARYALPTWAEWRKAAAYNAAIDAYYAYATSSNITPNNDLVDPDPGNNATYNDQSDFDDPEDYTIGPPYFLTLVGAHEHSVSPYGTFDQNGNATEWVEDLYYDNSRATVGGSFLLPRRYATVDPSRRLVRPSTFRAEDCGFRVVRLFGPVCGDGVFEPDAGEICEDGNTIDGDGCDSNCTFTACGNGIVTDGEVCDDGNLVNTDACLDTCVPASCGDGYLWGGEETCDDGNTADGDGCLATCEMACGLVGSIPAMDESLWRSSRNIIQLELAGPDCGAVAPLPGEVLIQELTGEGAYGDDLSAHFSLDIENGQLVIREYGSILQNQTWIAIRNIGDWEEVWPFELHLRVLIGDVDNTGKTMPGDMSIVAGRMPMFAAPEDSRFDINGDGRVLPNDLSVMNMYVPTFGVPKPSGH